MAETFFWGGRYWRPNEKAAFARWLQARGANYATWAARHPQVARRVFGGGGGSRHPLPGPPVAGKTPFNLADWAGKQYDDSMAPALASIEAERARARAETEQSMKNVQGMYAALAGMLGSIGPSISSNYQAAANTELAGGRGFGDQEAARGVAEGDKAAGYLTAAGAPQAAIEGAKAAAGGEGSGNVVYGTGGYIPATTTAREGAAFASAGAMLPAQAAGLGRQELRAVLEEALKSQAEFSDKIAELRAGRGAGVQKIIQDFMEQDRAERALRLQEGYLGNTVRSTGAKITGVDPLTGQPTYETVYDAAKTKADAAKARAAQKSKDKAAKQGAVKARESAFSSARHSMAVDAKAFVGRPTTQKEQMQWWAAHPKRRLSDAPKHTGGLTYAQAKQRLFAKYADLLRYATPAGRAALKRRLNAMIDEVLTAYGIRPSASTSPGASGPPVWAVASAGPR